MKVFITGSTTGLGFLAGKKLIDDGNDVYLHARNIEKAKRLKAQLPQVKGIAIGDLANLDDIPKIAEQVNSWGIFDVIIHNAGIDSNNSALTYQVNLAAPYQLTCLIHQPKRLIYIASGMHIGARLDINNLDKVLDYSGSKLALMLLMKRVARTYPQTIVNAIDPGWVPTRMGGQMANDNLEEGYLGQVWLSESNDAQALRSGYCYYHRQPENYDSRVDQVEIQDQLINKLQTLTGLSLSK